MVLFHMHGEFLQFCCFPIEFLYCAFTKIAFLSLLKALLKAIKTGLYQCVAIFKITYFSTQLNHHTFFSSSCTDLALESNPSDHPRASTIFLSKSQTDGKTMFFFFP